MKRLAAIAVALAVVVGSAAAEGQKDPAAGFLVVRPAGPHGPLVAFDARNGAKRFSLPAGTASADGRRFVAAQAASGATAVRTYDPATGRLLHSFGLEGRWALAAVSADGTFLALASDAGAIEVVSAPDGGVRNRLASRFDVDALSADGRYLFLIEHLEAGRYNVRLYDLAKGLLRKQPLREKGSHEIMAGTRWSSVPSRDGTWLLTLYLNTRKHEAFVHTLNLPEAYPVCIDLPSQGRLDDLKGYSIAISPGGGHAFAANPALGVVAELDLRRLRLSKTVRFRPDASGGSVAGAVSPNGRTLYFAGGSSLWAYDTVRGNVRGPYAAGAAVADLVFSRDGARVFAARSDGTIAAFETATGRRAF